MRNTKRRQSGDGGGDGGGGGGRQVVLGVPGCHGHHHNDTNDIVMASDNK